MQYKAAKDDGPESAMLDEPIPISNAIAVATPRHYINCLTLIACMRAAQSYHLLVGKEQLLRGLPQGYGWLPGRPNRCSVPVTAHGLPAFTNAASKWPKHVSLS